MDAKKPISPAVLIGSIVAVLCLVGVIAVRSFTGDAAASGPSGEAVRTVAPVEQRYPDGTVVPYNAAPSGAVPGDPSSIKR